MELVDRFDNKRMPLNKVTERYDRVRGELRQSVHLWIRNSKGEFLIQQRSFTKKVFPGQWSITGGAVDVGETPLAAVKRECKEELGVDLDEDNLTLVLSFIRELDFVDVFWLNQDVNLEDVKMEPSEVIDIAYKTPEEIRKMMDEKNFTPSVEFYYDMMLKTYDYYIENGGNVFDKDGNLLPHVK